MRLRPLVLLVLLAVGCGGDDEPAAPAKPTDTAAAPDTVVVKMKDILFVPEHITAHVGQTVRWTNKDSFAHTVKAVASASFASKKLSPGDTYEQEVTKRGKIAYVCTIHPSQNGTIDVVPK